MTIIEKLRQASMAERPGIITELYEKNINFFCKKYPEIDQFLKRTDCPYRFNITNDFIDIIHTPTNSLAHPENGLDNFAEALGQENHGAWNNFVNFQPTFIKDSPEHNRIIKEFEQSMNLCFPDLAKLLKSGKVQISTNGATEKVLPPIVFTGVFHGLHIDYLLKRIKTNRILLVEPEPERFEVSCYFLDYENLYNQFGFLPLQIGKEISPQLLNWFHSADKISSKLWVRSLPCYDSDHVAYVVDQIRIQQLLLDGQTTSYDKETRSLSNGFENIIKNIPILSEKASLSKKSRIAVVASGPSLQNDMEWLRENQKDLIIFAVHSSVRPLKKNGITPDFQVSIDTHLQEATIEKLGLDANIPLLSYYKAPVSMLESFNDILLLIEENITNPVDARFTLTDTHPSSTTLATSFVFFLNPSELYLLGVDVGFIKENKQFIGGGFHEDYKVNYNKDLIRKSANFPETDTVFSSPFLSKIQASLELQIQNNENKTTVYNLSDGARIAGAVSRKSNSCELSDYHEINKDVEKIIRCFRPAEVNQNYSFYRVNGESLLDDFRANLLKKLTLEEYCWLELGSKFDSCLEYTMKKSMEISPCLRMTIYERLIVDLLTQWYRYILLSQDAERAEEVYAEGFKFFKTALNRLEWPIFDC